MYETVDFFLRTFDKEVNKTHFNDVIDFISKQQIQICFMILRQAKETNYITLPKTTFYEHIDQLLTQQYIHIKYILNSYL